MGTTRGGFLKYQRLAEVDGWDSVRLFLKYQRLAEGVRRSRLTHAEGLEEASLRASPLHLPIDSCDRSQGAKGLDAKAQLLNLFRRRFDDFILLPSCLWSLLDSAPVIWFILDYPKQEARKSLVIEPGGGGGGGAHFGDRPFRPQQEAITCWVGSGGRRASRWRRVATGASPRGSYW
ncbi:hypothetical protein OPV22_029750 [Ensete ventricosum]|uniref:Uncharacterized protein n=1 Tax=Ensete ventricosum TaxID=4639 RepID=A0AAV8Q260_ENSVE|nr:hypothetical protein OPV22_029750 [Ensete ventricosum]